MESDTDNTNCLENPVVLSALEQILIDKFPNLKYNYKICKATEKGDNFIGVIYRITIDFNNTSNSNCDNTKQQQFSLILKVPPQNAFRRKQFFARPCFLREALAYNKFLPLTKQFQESKSITTTANGFFEYAECFCALTDDMNEAVFMEDLNSSNFQLFDRFDQLNEAHVTLVMRIYAKLHAISFALKDQQPTLLHPYQNILDIFEQRKNDIQLNIYFEELKKSALASLQDEYDSNYKIKLQNYFAKGTFFDLLLEMVHRTNCEPYTVVCHGDCWNNNILFKIERDKLVDARLIDWQLMRYASPVTDLMYYLFTCTTKEFRNEYYDKMLNTYYSELCAHITRLGSDASVLFPRDAFNKQLKQKGATGLLMAMIVLPIITMKSEDAPNLEQLSERIEAGNATDLKGAGFLADSNENEYNKRMRDTIIDCIECGYI